MAGNTVQLTTPSGWKISSQSQESVTPGSRVSLVLRPDVLQLSALEICPDGDNTAVGSIRTLMYQGEITAISIALGTGESLISHQPSRLVTQYGYREQDVVRVRWDTPFSVRQGGAQLLHV